MPLVDRNFLYLDQPAPGNATRNVHRLTCCILTEGGIHTEQTRALVLQYRSILAEPDRHEDMRRLSG